MFGGRYGAPVCSSADVFMHSSAETKDYCCKIIRVGYRYRYLDIIYRPISISENRTDVRTDGAP